MAIYHVNVRYIHCNNAEENEDFEWLWKQEAMGVKFNYTVLGTPQQNGRMEREFAILFNWVHDTLNNRKLSLFLKNGWRAKAASTATLQEDNFVTKSRDLIPSQQLLGSER